MSVRATPDGGSLLDVLVVPGASRSAVVGLHGDVLRVRVAAPPERGKANRAVCAVIAAALGIKRGDVHVVSGPTHRRKTLAVQGLEPAAVRARLGL